MPVSAYRVPRDPCTAELESGRFRGSSNRDLQNSVVRLASKHPLDTTQHRRTVHCLLPLFMWPVQVWVTPIINENTVETIKMADYGHVWLRAKVREPVLSVSHSAAAAAVCG